MTVIVIGITFAAIWLGTTFFIVRSIKKLKDDLLKKFSEIEKPPKKESECIPEENADKIPPDTEKPPEKESECIPEENAERQAKPFDFIRQIDPVILLNFLRQEHPQVIALILSYLDVNKASLILQYLPRKLQSDVSWRIACMDRVSPEVIHNIEQFMEKKLSGISNGYLLTGGVENVVDIINHVDRYTEKQVINDLEDEDPELAEEIKKRMFIFEDIVMLDDRAIQKVMREVDSQELAKALKNAGTKVQDKIFRNMSKRAAEMLKEDMDYMGPVRLRDIEDAQQKIVSIIRCLEDSGEIIIARSDEIIVG